MSAVDDFLSGFKHLDREIKQNHTKVDIDPPPISASISLSLPSPRIRDPQAVAISGKYVQKSLAVY